MKDNEKELIAAAFCAGLLVGVALIMVVLLFIRNATDVYAADGTIENASYYNGILTYIEIDEGPESAVEAVPELEDLGRFKITFYCRCGRCNGYFKDGSPRSVNRFGEPLKWGMIAVDPNVIPMHTRVMIDGFDDVVFEAVDTGGDNVIGKHVDVFFPGTHKEALKANDSIGRAKVWKVVE